MVQISERSVGPDDVVVTTYPHSELWKLPVDGYHRVPERTWGRLDRNSPVSGLCTDMVDTCLVFICQCKSTDRTTMMHTPTMVDMQAIVDQLDYVTNKAAVPAEIIILRGGIYSDSKKHVRVGDVLRSTDDDEVWVDQFVYDMRAHAKKLALPLTITRPVRCLEHGCVLVDKRTGKITIPVPAHGFMPGRYPHVGPPGSMTETQFAQLSAKDDFYRIISTAHAISMQQFGFRLAYPCYLQYDGTSSTPLPRMPDFARTLLQQYVVSGPLSPGLVVPISEKLDVNISEELRGYINHYPLREQGMFCEFCRKPTKQTCNSCRTAWFCCRDHQTSNWKDHRAWCKAHRVAGSSSTPKRRDSGESQASTQPSSKIVRRQETSDTPKAVITEATGGKEIVSHEQNGQKGEEVSVSHVISQEVKIEVIERSATPEKIEDNIEQNHVEQSEAEQGNAEQGNAEQGNAEQGNAEQDNADQDNAVAVKEEETIATTSTELESSPRPQKVLTLRDRDPRPLLRQLCAKLSLMQASDAGAIFHRNLKIVVRLLSSWKFYFCIASVVFAYIIRAYDYDIHLIYPLA